MQEGKFESGRGGADEYQNLIVKPQLYLGCRVDGMIDMLKLGVIFHMAATLEKARIATPLRSMRLI